MGQFDINSIPPPPKDWKPSQKTSLDDIPAPPKDWQPKKASGAGSPQGYQPTPQDIQQKNSLNAVQTGSEKLQNGSNPSQNSKGTELLNNLNQYIKNKQQNATGEEKLNLQKQQWTNQIQGATDKFEKEHPGSWDNLAPIVTHALTKFITKPLAGAASLTRSVSNLLPGGDNSEKDLYDKNGNITEYGKTVDAGKTKDYLGKLITDLDSYNNETDKEDYLNPLPRTFMGNTVGGLVGLAPTVGAAALFPEGEAEEALSPLAKLKQVTVNPFTKISAIQGGLDSYDKAKQKGKSDVEALVEAGKGAATEGGQAAIYNVLGEIGGNAVSPKIAKYLTENGITDNGKLTKMGTDAVSDALVFSAYPIASDLIQGKQIDWDNVETNLGTGLLFGGLKAMKTGAEFTEADQHLKQGIALHNLMDASPEAIKEAHDNPHNPADLQAMSVDYAAKAKNETDLNKRKQLIAASSVYGKLGNIKTMSQAILADKDGFIKGINESDLSDENKQKFIDKINETHKNLDPFEKQKTDLGKQISDKDEQIKSFSEKSDDPVKNAENEVNLEQAKKEREDLNNQLKSIILKQKDNEQLKNEGENRETPNAEKSKETEQTVGQESNPVQEGRQNDVSDTGATNAPITEPRQKAIDAVVHGIVASSDEKFDGYSPRFDFGMTTAEKQKAVRDIKNGNYETAPAKKMLAKLEEWEKNDNYPVIEGSGGHTIRRRGATAEEIQNAIDDAKASKLGEISERQINEFNESAKDLGITYNDVKAHEEYEQSRYNPEPRRGVSENIQQPENDNGTGTKQNQGDKNPPTVETKGGVKDATQENQNQESGDKTDKTGDSNATNTPKEDEGQKGQTQNAKPKKLTLKKYEKKPPVGDVEKTMAEKIRSLKSQKGNTYGGLQGVGTAIWDGALETAATAIEAGVKLSEAIQKAIDHIKSKSTEDDEDKIRKAITESLAEAGIVDRYQEPEMIEANNAFLDAKIKNKFGQDALDHIINKLQDTSLKNVVEKVKAKIEGDKNYLDDVRNRILKSGEGNAEDQAALLMDQYDLKKQEEKLINQINESKDPKEIKVLQDKLSDIQDYIKDNATANRMLGRETSTMFRLRQVAVDADANLDYMMRERTASNGGKELTPEQQKEVKEAYQKIREAELEVKKAKEAEIKAREQADRLQQENDALKKIIDQAKSKHATTQKGQQDRLTQIRSSIDNSKKELGKLFGNVTSGGILQPEIYKHLGNIVKGKAEELYVKTKANIELNHLVKSVMDEIKDVAPDIKEQDVRDAITGNYQKEARKPKTELQKNIAELKKQAGLIKKINDIQNNIDTETKKRGESSPEVKKLQKQLADLKKEAKISGDFEAMNEGTLNTEPQKSNKTELDDRQKNINKYKQIQRQIKDIQGKIDRKEFTTPAQEAKKYEKSDALKAAEKELAKQKYIWDRLNRREMQKNRPLVNKIGDFLVSWTRFTALSRIATIGKLATVVAQGLISKPLKSAVQDLVARITPKDARGVINGRVRPQSLAKYYSAAIRNFSIENLKDAFKGLDEADILYGKGKYMEDYDIGSGFSNDFMELPGRTHGYLKSFIKSPETAFAHEQLMQDHIEKYQDIENQLNNKDLTDKERADLEQKKEQYDVSRDDVRERINTLAAEHGKWAIFMNKNHGIESFRNMLSRFTSEKTTSATTKAFGYLLKTDAPVLKIPMNFARRFFLYKYGLLKAVVGTDWIVGKGEGTKGLISIALNGADDMTENQKELLSRSLTYGSYGAALFTAGIFFKGKVKRNDDGSMDVGSFHLNKTEANIASDSPGAESFLSGAFFGRNLKNKYNWAKALVESDIDVAKKMPFNSMLKYGFVANFALALMQKDKDGTLTKIQKAAIQKAKNTTEPGFYQESLQYFDPYVNDRTPNNFKQGIEKETLILSKKVPR